MTFEGLEAIGFNLKSKLGSTVEKAFQDVMDYRDSLPVSTADSLCDDVTKFFKKNTIPVICDSFEKFVGYTNVELALVDGNPSAFFAIETLPPLDVESVLAAEAKSTGVSSWYKLRDDLSNVAELSKHMDRERGHFTPAQLKKCNVKITLYFSISYGFLRAAYLPENINLTAGELTAIVLHEVGHSVTIIEHLADEYYYANTFHDDIRNKLLTELDPADKKAQIANVQKFLRENADDSALSNASIALGDAINNHLDETNVFSVIGGVLSCLLILYVLMVEIIVLTEMRSVFFLDLSIGNFAKLGSVKTSDVTSNNRNDYQIERWADEYCARNGYGAELASGLARLYEDGKYLNAGVNQYNKNSTVVGCGAVMLDFFSGLFSGIVGINASSIFYENEINRNKRIRENIYGVFKNANMTKTESEFYWRQLTIIDAVIKKQGGFRETAIGKFYTTLISNLLSPARWLTYINDGNLHKDYEKLADKLDKLNDNALYSISSNLRNR